MDERGFRVCRKNPNERVIPKRGCGLVYEGSDVGLMEGEKSQYELILEANAYARRALQCLQEESVTRFHHPQMENEM